MIKEWLDEYKPRNMEAAEQALREIMQEITLAGLQRSGFFEIAAFYGGTALRIFHKLPRFSEDLDFSLLKDRPGFSLEPYLEGIKSEFNALGITVSIDKKQKTIRTNVDSAFLKPDTSWKELIIKEILPQESVKMRMAIRIKIEVDTKPPQGFQTEQKLLVRPFSFYTTCYTLPDLFAGKMHALLFRKWKNRVKGRDWYDLDWYIQRKIPLNLDHLATRSKDSGDWKSGVLTIDDFQQLIKNKIESVNMDRVREDVMPFISNDQQLTIWSQKYFADLAQQIRYNHFYMTINNEDWSAPQMVQQGKNIRVTANGSLTVKVFNATGISVSKMLNPVDKRVEFTAAEIIAINPQMITFKKEDGKKVLVECLFF